MTTFPGLPRQVTLTAIVSARRGITLALLCATLSPTVVFADASARAYLADERVPGAITGGSTDYVHGPLEVSVEVGAPSDAGYAYAYANLGSGILRAVGKSVYAPPYVTTTDAATAITDTVTFTGGVGMTAYLDYSFEGTLGVVDDNIPKAAIAQMMVNVTTVGSSATVYETLSAYIGNCGFPNCLGTSAARTGTVAFQIFEGDTSFSMSLFGSASIGNSFDFGNTAKFFLRVPGGVSYTSASGNFLTSAAPITPVPEPANFAMFFAGLALLGLATRKRATP